MLSPSSMGDSMQHPPVLSELAAIRKRARASIDEGAVTAGDSLAEMIREDLLAERIAIDSYRQFIQYLGDKDPTTRRMPFTKSSRSLNTRRLA